MAAPALLLAVHGTRDPAGAAVARGLARSTAALLNGPERPPGDPDARRVAVRLAFADVLSPDVAQVAARLAGPAVLVPAFLAAGYHVRADIPAQLERAGRGDIAVAPALGTHPALVRTAVRRLAGAGWRPGDAVVLAAAGSSDPAAAAQAGEAADAVAAALPGTVRPAFIAVGTPGVADAVADLRARGHRRVCVSPWLLAPGVFHRRLGTAGADAVAAPLCPSAAVASVLADRYLAAARTHSGVARTTS
ncbi:sirohydrochlorin ferrochelatase [Murinocardiopsis flavida]|uniref:Sirohydrochlorin ferrochelatase n=1 Tax=Murinocardiopsis flavida TaxID=645275 RepID=A0A2P8DNN9_9ACTN|nr:CbiX/SirB N-terminal domain-containing protein [Murinocardiopsis flavida]PSK98832.1 sirohydrochlorin ferrochelatase [Murinocardiopsis flavida]